MTIENAIAALSLLSIGGLLGNYFRILWERKNSALLQKQEFKETRYKCIIMLMLGALDFEKSKPALNKHGRNFITRDDLLDELEAEWHNMILFASDEVLTGTHEFISDPTHETYRKASLAMRKDLWGGKLSKSIRSLTFKKQKIEQGGAGQRR
jgi:hypothetical protein